MQEQLKKEERDDVVRDILDEVEHRKEPSLTEEKSVTGSD